MKPGRLRYANRMKVWRLDISILFGQIIGGALSLAIGQYHFSFIKFWFGAALGTLPGFIIGLLWQLKAGKDRGSWLKEVYITGFLAIFIVAFSLFIVFPRMQSELQGLKELKILHEETISQIDVYDQYGEKKLMSIRDAESIDSFAIGISDVVGHSPNHPQYSNSWYIIIRGATRHELEIYLNPEFPSSVIGAFVRKSGSQTWNYGNFESKGIRPWVEKHLMAVDPEK